MRINLKTDAHTVRTKKLSSWTELLTEMATPVVHLPLLKCSMACTYKFVTFCAVIYCPMGNSKIGLHYWPQTDSKME